MGINGPITNYYTIGSNTVFGAQIEVPQENSGFYKATYTTNMEDVVAAPTGKKGGIASQPVLPYGDAIAGRVDIRRSSSPSFDPEKSTTVASIPMVLPKGTDYDFVQIDSISIKGNITTLTGSLSRTNNVPKEVSSPGN